MLFYVLTGKRSRSLAMTEGPGTTAGLWESASGTAFLFFSLPMLRQHTPISRIPTILQQAVPTATSAAPTLPHKHTVLY